MTLALVPTALFLNHEQLDPAFWLTPFDPQPPSGPGFLQPARCPNWVGLSNPQFRLSIFPRQDFGSTKEMYSIWNHLQAKSTLGALYLPPVAALSPQNGCQHTWPVTWLSPEPKRPFWGPFWIIWGGQNFDICEISWKWKQNQRRCPVTKQKKPLERPIQPYSDFLHSLPILAIYWLDCFDSAAFQPFRGKKTQIFKKKTWKWWEPKVITRKKNASGTRYHPVNTSMASCVHSPVGLKCPPGFYFHLLF